jgi:hypothetical protein
MTNSDVQTLIGALTTERDALDRAIVALKAIGRTAQRDAMTSRATSHPRPVRDVIDSRTKAEVAERMAHATHKSDMARKLGTEYGIKPQTIASAWCVWRRALGPMSRSNDPTTPVAFSSVS